MNKSRGFTLLEIMVVVLIIGIILSFATLSFRDNRVPALKEEAQRLAALLDLAREEAILTSREYSVTLKETGYDFQQFLEEEWSPLVDDKTLRARELPKGMILEADLEGESILFGGEEEVRLYIFSSGELTPFDLFLRYDGETEGFHVVGQITGKIEFKDPQKEQ
ncbi:MAG TPA: type II secretion system protein GspH [Gammaproteobacteria bacterium]|nr:type II secretion system protein GspH [Gammaproteobacteria bacterium]